MVSVYTCSCCIESREMKEGKIAQKALTVSTVQAKAERYSATSYIVTENGKVAWPMVDSGAQKGLVHENQYHICLEIIL